MPRQLSLFKPPWWFRSPHVQTLWPYLFRRPPEVDLRRERFELSDGDFVDIDWTTRQEGPRVLVLHGLEGSSRSHYAGGILSALHAQGWRAGLLHARGCSGEPNRLARRYHAGDTGDLQSVFDTLRQREPDSPVAVIGYSLGGSILLNWLAEAERPVAAAVAVSVPFDLNGTAQRLASGFSWIYQRGLLRRLYLSVCEKRQVVEHELATRIDRIPKSFREFDHAYTAPLHGFRGVDHYYQSCSCGPKLRRIRTPVLILQAADDPFMPAWLPDEAQLSDAVTLEVSAHGGHVGFVHGSLWRPRFWLEERIPAYFRRRLEHYSPHATSSMGDAVTAVY